MIELVINQFGLGFGLPLGFGRDFQQRIGFGIVAVRRRRFVFPFYAYRRGRLKLRQRFECTGFEQVMGVLSVGAFDGKGVFLPVVNGGFPVADFGGTPAQRIVAVFGAAVAVFYFNELVVAVPMVVRGFAIAGFADQVAALVVVVVYACVLFKQVAPDFVQGWFFLAVCLACAVLFVAA